MPRHTVPPPTKEIFIPATSGTDRQNLGDHTGYLINANAEYAITEFMAPQDFHNIISAEIVVVAIAAVANMSLTITTDYGGAGEAYNVHSESTARTQNTTANTVYRLNIADALSALAALDHVGIRAEYLTNTNALILGVRLRYT